MSQNPSTEPRELKLGIIGMSDGNGHPYSWAAICNGYDKAAMESCPFPGIPAYLAARSFPKDRLPGVAVTHVWTQDESRSRHIAAASLIPNVAPKPEDMIGKVDGLLLARDDAENHARFALPFESSLPVYIDKPLALTRAAAEKLLAAATWPGQIFTGTAVAWAAEMNPSAEDAARIGRIRHVAGVTPKYRDTYGVHVIEPALKLLGIARAPDEVSATGIGKQRFVTCLWHAEGLSAEFAALGALSAPIGLTLYGESGFQALTFKDSFTAFRTALHEFCEGVRRRERRFDLARTLAVTDILERGRG